MKKNGFTLAEVLITLAIIGVVATLTLPALMNNTAEQQYKTGLRKAVNTLTEAANMNQAIDGWDFGDIKSEATDDDTTQSVYALLTKRTNVDYRKTGTGSHDDGGAVVTSNYTVYLRDGSSITFDAGDSSNKAYQVNQDDKLPLGIPVVFDTNGAKGPNKISNCGKQAEATATYDDSGNNCSDASNRVIKDQFGLRLRGSVVVPNGAAARWAYEN